MLRATAGHDPAGPGPLTKQRHGDDVLPAELFDDEGKDALRHARRNRGWHVAGWRTKETLTAGGHRARDGRTAAACPEHIASLTNPRLVPADVCVENGYARYNRTNSRATPPPQITICNYER